MTVSINDLIERRAEIKRETEQLNNRLKDLKTAQDEIDLALLKKMDAEGCLLYTSPSPRDGLLSRMPSSA